MTDPNDTPENLADSIRIGKLLFTNVVCDERTLLTIDRMQEGDIADFVRIDDGADDSLQVYETCGARITVELTEIEIAESEEISDDVEEPNPTG